MKNNDHTLAYLFAILIAIILIIVGAAIINTNKDSKNNLIEPSSSDIYDYQDKQITISVRDGNNISVSTVDGNKSAVIEFIYYHFNVDPTNYKITFIDYENPFKIYE